MKYLIHHDEDAIAIEGDTIKDIQEKAHQELQKRNWNEDDCWSEEIKGRF